MEDEPEPLDLPIASDDDEDRKTEMDRLKEDEIFMHNEEAVKVDEDNNSEMSEIEEI